MISKLPAMAGTTRFISHIVAVAILMPRLFTLNNSSNFRLTLPRRPNSAMAKVGMIASTKKITLTAQQQYHHAMSTSNKRKSKKYCTMKTIYLTAERDNNFKSIVARISSKELTSQPYRLLFCNRSTNLASNDRRK